MPWALERPEWRLGNSAGAGQTAFNCQFGAGEKAGRWVRAQDRQAQRLGSWAGCIDRPRHSGRKAGGERRRAPRWHLLHCTTGTAEVWQARHVSWPSATGSPILRQAGPAARRWVSVTARRRASFFCCTALRASLVMTQCPVRVDGATGAAFCLLRAPVVGRHATRAGQRQ